jgi:diguanylate cyclase (GGDEF)-like protein
MTGTDFTAPCAVPGGEGGRNVTVQQYRPPWRVVVGTIATVGVLGVLAAAGVVRARSSFDVAADVAGAVALACGGVLVLRSRPGSDTVGLRGGAGAALMLWAAGQLLHEVIGSGARSSRLVDMLAILAALAGVAGALTIPLHGSEWQPRIRLGVDAAVLGVTICLLAWRFGYSALLIPDSALVLQGSSGTHLSSAHVLTALLLLADVIVTCVVVLAAVRDLDRSLIVIAIGLLLYAVGHALVLRALLRAGGVPSWEATLLWSLAWPVIAVGLFRYEPNSTLPPDRSAPYRSAPYRSVPSADTDARVVAFTTISSLILLAVGVVAIIATPDKTPDVISLSLVLAAVVAFGLRELFNARQRAILLRRLHEEATVDPLTGLANRRVLADRLSVMSEQGQWCLLVVDIDGFKEFNDLLGHSAGDRLLLAVTHRLSSVLPPQAVLSRVGGDEFAVLIPGGPARGLELAQRLVAAVRLAGGDVDGTALVPVSASVGVADVQGARQALAARGDPGADQPLAPLSAAGAAQRMARTAGHNRVELFDGPVARMWQRRLSVEQRLRTAIKSGAFDVHFQPIVDLNRLEVTGAEALARWRDEELGSVDPAEFIPVAEESGLVVALGELIMRRTLDEAVAAGLVSRGLRLSCNVSPVQLRVPGFHRMVEQVLAAHEMQPESLVVEVTEAVMVEEAGQAVRTLRWLADAGVTIAIDDFGTGYSALGYLRRLPAHMLKVDKSLTSSLEDEPRAMAITQAVIELGASIGMSIVVEGIETTSVAELVTRMGAGYGQGSLFGRPMLADALASTCDRIHAIPRPA